MSQQAALKEDLYTNRLIEATSPYLLQHAHNPVDWYPWGPEAIEKARRENKPIFLSIGYSACHWCHVMERESFEKPDTAEVLNKHFVSIKVDREERPDLDELYMKATLLYNRGNGGWPMSVFLLPEDQTPFFAGTYFPPISRHGLPGFADLLRYIANLWRQNPQRMRKTAHELSDAVRQFGEPRPLDAVVTRDLVSRSVNTLATAFDVDRGGLLSDANKFPPSLAMSLLLREYEHTRRLGRPDGALLQRVTVTLERMANGGIYDHLAGGIARYSTDPDWLVPHFEKMLYDQALVSGVYLEACQVTGERKYADVAADILNYVLADMRSPEGAFFSARDADSEGVEGKYYVWTKKEIMATLGSEAGELFCSYYDVTDDGNWEGHNILNVQREAAMVARLHEISTKQLQESLGKARAQLLAVRSQRIPPNLDDKILTGWNALMITSLARGSVILGRQRYAQAAVHAAEFIVTKMMQEGGLLRTARNGKAHIPAYLDDYAFLVEAMLELHQATFDWRWMDWAVRLNDAMVERFWDEKDGAFYSTAGDAERLFARTKEVHDGVLPSGNSVAIMNLLRLAAVFDREDLREKAERAIHAIAGEVTTSPYGHERLLAAMDLCCSSPTEIVIAGPIDATETNDLINVAKEGYGPDRIVLVFDPSADAGQTWRYRVPLLNGKELVEGEPAAYVCINQTCLRPATSASELRSLLRKRGSES